MRRIILPTLFIFALSVIACGQAKKLTVQTTANQNARYEIIKSPMMASWTFRLDKFTGDIWILSFPTENGQLSWTGMRIQSFQPSRPIKPTFQIFMANEDVRQTFLINTDTGQTWVLSNTTNEKTGEKFLMWASFTKE